MNQAVKLGMGMNGLSVGAANRNHRSIEWPNVSIYLTARDSTRLSLRQTRKLFLLSEIEPRTCHQLSDD